MHSWRPKLPTACWSTSSGAGLPSGRRINASMSSVAEPRYCWTPRLNRLGVSQRPRPVSGEAHDVRRAGHVGVEVSVRQQAVARRRTGHVTERDVHRETDTGRAGSERLHRGERPVTVVEQHADVAGCRQRNHNVLAVPPVEVSDRDRLRGRRQGDVGAHEAHRSVLRRGPERNRPQRRLPGAARASSGLGARRRSHA